MRISVPRPGNAACSPGKEDAFSDPTMRMDPLRLGDSQFFPVEGVWEQSKSGPSTVSNFPHPKDRLAWREGEAGPGPSLGYHISSISLLPTSLAVWECKLHPERFRTCPKGRSRAVFSLLTSLPPACTLKEVKCRQMGGFSSRNSSKPCQEVPEKGRGLRPPHRERYKAGGRILKAEEPISQYPGGFSWTGPHSSAHPGLAETPPCLQPGIHFPSPLKPGFIWGPSAPQIWSSLG